MPLFRSREARASIESPNLPLTSTTLADLFTGPKSSAGVHVTEVSASRVTSVYRAWSLIAGSIGSLPIQTYTGEIIPERWRGDGSKLLAYPGGRDEMTGLPYMGSVSASVFWETVLVHELSWGNSYIVKIPNVARTRTVALDLLIPSMVYPRWGRKTADNPTGKEYIVYNGGGTRG